MLTMRLMAALAGSMVINLNMTTCRSPGETDKTTSPTAASSPQKVELEGIDTSDLTPRERAQWSAHVSEQLAPCKKVPVSVAECVQKKKDCSACTPAAKYLLSLVRRGLTPGQVDGAYEGRFSPDAVRDIDIADAPIKGPVDAPITIVEFADFECPACRHATSSLDEVITATDDVRLIFKNFPLSIHEHAETAARASVAAGNQGKFWEMHHALMIAPPPLDQKAVTGIARSLGLDIGQFDSDLRSEAVADAVLKDRKAGENAKISATPTIFINGREFRASTDMKSDLLEWIELERKLVDAPAKKTAAPVEAAPVEAAPVEAAPVKPADSAPEKPAAPASDETQPAAEKPAAAGPTQ